MARKRKTKSGKSSTAWKRCAGVNSRTGRIKKGYRSKRKGCPVRVARKRR